MHMYFKTNITELQLTNIGADYLVGRMHCGPPSQNCGLAMAHLAHPPWDRTTGTVRLGLELQLILHFAHGHNESN